MRLRSAGRCTRPLRVAESRGGSSTSRRSSGPRTTRACARRASGRCAPFGSTDSTCTSCTGLPATTAPSSTCGAAWRAWWGRGSPRRSACATARRAASTRCSRCGPPSRPPSTRWRCIPGGATRRRSQRARRAESTSPPTLPSAEASAPAPAPVCWKSRSCVRLQRSSAGRQLRLCCAGPSPAGAASCQRALRGRASRRMRGPCGSHLERAAGRERWRRCEPLTPLSRSSGG
mmetsp:Transcript_1878/g.6195  ORF Transcript_1878/g.6195 Transcript_1878/m.6195 type:complete len:232 (-) Transcript_1878:228-923(-)